MNVLAARDLMRANDHLRRLLDNAEAEIKRLRKAKRPGRVLARGWWCPVCRGMVEGPGRCGQNGAKVIRVEVREAGKGG